MKKLRVVLVKPGKYAVDGAVERFQKGFMPNASLYHLASLTPSQVADVKLEVHTVDEYVRGDLDYLDLLSQDTSCQTLLALVGVQSHQFHRALDLAAYAKSRGVEHCVIGGPHAMTCDTTDMHGRGVSFALAEAEVVWMDILEDAVAGQIKDVYSPGMRWRKRLDGAVVQPPAAAELERYVLPMLGLYPVRGCPYRCNYCSVVKIAGHPVRSTAIGTTMDSLRRARDGGVRYIAFVSDNFNKYPQAAELLEAMIDADLGLRFFCQCDTHVVNQPDLFELLNRAGCFEMFVGVESFNRETLKAASKFHNYPKKYQKLASLCDENGIRAHFSNIIGFAEDTEQSILDGLEILKGLNPPVASFYVLTPIPGTEQYDEFLDKGLVTEKNLDRFDTTCSVWRHPTLSGSRLEELLYYCYVDYYRHLMQQRNRRDEFPEFTVFCRYIASQGIHPMAGGAGRVTLDGVSDYIGLRRSRYGFEHAPLPRSLSLSAEDEAFNRSSDWKKAAG
ncbi:MAG: radical SAM protein [Proteobacteria bacterium]|nr:MAG: radical SAM protein [Pseudomonadota bacterium]